MIIYGNDFSDRDIEFSRQFGLGLEVLKYANPIFADNFSQNKEAVSATLEGVSGAAMHGAYNDTYYTSVDPLICEVARKRFVQSMEIAQAHGINSVVFHSAYRKFLNGGSAQAVDSYIARAVEFWRELPVPDGMTIFVENVEDEDPEVFLRLFDGIARADIRCCLDIGHAFFNGRSVSLNRWIDTLKDHIGHVHIHDNNGIFDEHLPLGKGGINLTGVINKVMHAVGDNVPFVLECDVEESVKWLRDIGYDV